jgi:hypothetical protein
VQDRRALDIEPHRSAHKAAAPDKQLHRLGLVDDRIAQAPQLRRHAPKRFDFTLSSSRNDAIFDRFVDLK